MEKTKIKQRYRIAVNKSNKFITAQIVDDVKGVTLVSVNSTDTKAHKTKNDQAIEAAKYLAGKAKTAKISHVSFDRCGNKYHGRIKSFAEMLRQEGLEF